MSKLLLAATAVDVADLRARSKEWLVPIIFTRIVELSQYFVLYNGWVEPSEDRMAVERHAYIN